MSVSKGVDYFTFSSGASRTSKISAPKFAVGPLGPDNNFVSANHQIRSDQLPWYTFDGRLDWSAQADGHDVAAGNQEIDTLTGNLGDGTMDDMMSTPSKLGATWAVSHGFYDSGSGAGTPLTNQDQLYVYTTDNYSNWMRDIVGVKSGFGTAPFGAFVLPGSHDAGMNTLATISEMVTIVGAEIVAGALLTLPIGPFLVAAGGAAVLARLQLPRVLMNLAITQKDTISTQLDLGVRYLDFRPGLMAPALATYSPGTLFHQHLLIPGMSYQAFLQEVLRWLAAHPGEIVVVSANTQGFIADDMKPDASRLAAELKTALDATGLASTIHPGDKSALTRSYNDLVAAGTRLVFLNQISSPPETTKYDSYSDAYATTDRRVIVAELDKMTRAGQAGSDYTVLQLQGTANAIGSVIATSVLTTSDSYSPLMSTKASFDAVTYPWCAKNAATFDPRQPLVLLNDFADNAMVSTAIGASWGRLEQTMSPT